MTEPPANPVPQPVPTRRLWRPRADSLLVVLVLGFAFLAASVPARNSDLWLHLAAGRLLAEGNYRFGVDPFSHTTEGVYWANHAWLFDVLLYAGYGAVGGKGLVLLKAVGVAALAGVLLAAARSRGPFWVAALCTLLVVLASSPRLLLQPACLSLPLLAVCLLLLRAGGRWHRALPVLVALWVNLDGWFLLGPALVGLFLLGRLLDPDDADNPPRPRWLLPACLLACLFSPHHVRALVPPPELSPAVWSSAFRDDPRFAGLFASPWRWAPLGAAGGYSLAAWAYFALLGLGLASFALNRKAVRGWRGLVWLAFALLGAWQVRLVPFFAVVAGPVTALNLREVLGETTLVRTGRTLTAVAALGLMLLAWPGWLQGFGARDRAVGWAVHPDPSLVRAAEELAGWRQGTAFPPGSRLFETHPDAAHHLAWFAPGEKTFLDSRLHLFTRVAEDYSRAGKALGLLAGDAGDAAGVFRDYAIGPVLLFDPDPSRRAAGLRHATDDGGGVELLRVEGGAALAWWKGNPAGRPAVPPFDPDRAAFGPCPDPTPGEGPAWLPEPRPWWEYFARRPRPDSADTAAAETYLGLHDDAVARAAARKAAPHLSPAMPLLTVRSARLALATRPDDAAAWGLAGQAYLTLTGTTWEAEPGVGFALLTELRRIQATGALHQAATLDPSSVLAHDLLAAVFAARGFTDFELRHRAAQLRLLRRAGRPPGEDPAAFADRLDRLTGVVEAVTALVQDNENRFLVRVSAFPGDPLARARIAMQLGLIAKAQDILLRSHPDLYGAEGVRILAQILVLSGQAEEARVLLDRDELVRNPGALGTIELQAGAGDGRTWNYRLAAYDWFDLGQAAAAGRYDRAAAALDRLRRRTEAEESQAVPGLTRTLARQVGSEFGFAPTPAGLLTWLHVSRQRGLFSDMYSGAKFLTAQRADLYALDGLLLLELGRPADAAARLDLALAEYDRAGGSPALPGRAAALRYRDAARRYTP